MADKEEPKTESGQDSKMLDPTIQKSKKSSEPQNSKTNKILSKSPTVPTHSSGGEGLTSEEKSKEKLSKVKKKKEVEAVVNIYTSFNNTIVHVTDMAGQTLAKVTGGMTTKHGRLKANPTIAMFIAKRIDENIKDMGVKSLYFRIRAKTRNPAPGPGAHAIIKSLSRAGYKILNILDTTRIPRGGPKRKGGRRGRRP